ncbi:MAG: NYN domain-containing protein [Clostridiales bacterium]|jgi:predicted RNA-binding protein with PIN domain|nr:NYN domain-containing protein [Clostridiales bacterium]
MKSSDASIRNFDFLLVDGYNIIHDWELLSTLADISLEFARDALINMLANYQGFKDIGIIIVFDAHKIRHGHEKVLHHGNVAIVYTQEFETADAYIERTVQNLTDKAKPYRIAVATSDSLEQVVVMAKGAIRLSAADFLAEIETTEAEIRRKIAAARPVKNNQLLDNLDPAMARWLEAARLKKEL